MIDVAFSDKEFFAGARKTKIGRNSITYFVTALGALRIFQIRIKQKPLSTKITHHHPNLGSTLHFQYMQEFQLHFSTQCP